MKFCDDVDNVQEMLSGVITGIKQNPKEVYLINIKFRFTQMMILLKIRKV